MNSKIFKIKKSAIEWLVISIVVFFSVPSFADPSGLLRKMMETQISMFSYGIDKLNAEVKSHVNNDGWFGSVSYDWDSNQIYINYSNYTDKICASESECFDVIKKIDASKFKYWCLSRNDDGKCDILDVATDSFTPRGYAIRNFYDGKSSEVAITDVRNFIIIKGLVYKNKKKYTCTRKYISQNMMCGIE